MCPGKSKLSPWQATKECGWVAQHGSELEGSQGRSRESEFDLLGVKNFLKVFWVDQILKQANFLYIFL